MKVHHFSILVWCVVSVNPSVVWPQLSHILNSHGPRIMWPSVNNMEGVVGGQGDISSKWTNQIAHIRLCWTRETVEIWGEVQHWIYGHDEAVIGENSGTRWNKYPSTYMYAIGKNCQSSKTSSLTTPSLVHKLLSFSNNEPNHHLVLPTTLIEMLALPKMPEPLCTTQVWTPVS